jgi:hypothetical protein
VHKSIIIFFSLLTILLPLGNSLNISNANGIADFDKADKKQVSVNSLKCDNINVNVNGLELSVLSPFLGSEVAAEAVESNTDVNSFAAGNNEDGSRIHDFRFICINNNNNTVIWGEESESPEPPTPTTANLTVNKTTTCDPEQFGEECDTVYQISITGNNPTPNTFNASDTTVVVTFGAGVYNVNETGFQPGLAQCAGFDGGQLIGENIYTCTDFSEDCSGDISAGESLSCNIENTVIGADLISSSSSPTIAQGTGDTPFYL